MAEKLEVNLAKLETLLETAGYKDLVFELQTQVTDSRFSSRKERDDWICLLAESDRVSHQEIATCLGPDGISRGLITHITKKRGVVAAPKKTTRQRALAHLRLLKTAEGQKSARAAIAEVSNSGELTQQEVIQALGFPEIVSEDLLAEVWVELIDAGII